MVLGTLSCCVAGAWAQNGAQNVSDQVPNAQRPQLPRAADPLADIYDRLDEQLVLGVGRIGARRRPTASPKAQPTQPEGDGRYVPRTREAYRRELDQRFERAIETNQAAERNRRESFNADIVAQCGPQPQTGAQLGMSQERFEACGQEIRFGGGLTHVISLRVRGLDARLYVFAEGNVYKVYAVDQHITRIEPRPLHVVQVTLPQVGGYPPFVSNPQIVALSQGNLFGYGQTHAEDWSQPAGADLPRWADKVRRINASVPAPPFMWDARRQGWVQLPTPPACAGLWHQHTLTALADDRVLVAGGLCDIPRLLNDMGTFEPQTRTALWDARQRTWLESPRLTQPRIYHTASVLDGERVMLAGGLDDPLTVAGAGPEDPQQNGASALSAKAVRALDSVEMLVDGQWRSLPPLRTARAKHTATVLPDGQVLVAGGVGNGLQAIAKVELWDPVQHQWLPRAALHTPRYGHTATLLADGRVLVTGGINAQEEVLNTTELYDPATDTWADGAPLPEHLQGHTALRLADGRVLMAGGLVSATVQGPWMHSWHPTEAAWRAEGVPEAGGAGALTHRPTLVEAMPGQVLAFSSQAVYRYRLPGAVRTAGTQPGEPGQVPADVADLPSFPLVWWKEPPPAPAATPAPPAQPMGQPGRLARFGQDLWAARATLGWLAAGLLGLALLRRRRQQRGEPAFPDTLPLQGRGSTRKRNAPPTRQTSWKGWVVRVLVYGALLIVAVPNLKAYWGLRTADMAEGCRTRPAACLDPGTGLLASQPAVPERSALATPRIPCPFVGSWVTRRGNSEFHIDLQADGRYHMNGNTLSVPADDGHWAVQGKYILWRSTTHPVAEMDINRIVSNDGSHFELIEANGLHSHFDREADLPSGRCEP
ncbi:hypothetical protein AZKH_p0503 (plasmid) [Azoarcus sp. KH32C]|nr:hypothetical protein AZKH_p0503 [Azoarcus sp. KH32C]